MNKEKNKKPKKINVPSIFHLPFSYFSLGWNFIPCWASSVQWVAMPYLHPILFSPFFHRCRRRFSHHHLRFHHDDTKKEMQTDTKLNDLFTSSIACSSRNEKEVEWRMQRNTLSQFLLFHWKEKAMAVVVKDERKKCFPPPSPFILLNEWIRRRTEKKVGLMVALWHEPWASCSSKKLFFAYDFSASKPVHFFLISSSRWSRDNAAFLLLYHSAQNKNNIFSPCIIFIDRVHSILWSCQHVVFF